MAISVVQGLTAGTFRGFQDIRMTTLLDNSLWLRRSKRTCAKNLRIILESSRGASPCSLKRRPPPTGRSPNRSTITGGNESLSMVGPRSVGQTKTLWLSLTGFTNRSTRNFRLLRRVGILGYTSIVRANVFLPPPKVLLNGPGKSGTHLLSACLSLMPKMMFSGRHFALPNFFAGPARSPSSRSRQPGSPPPLDVTRLKKYMERCPQGMFVTAHATFHPDFSDLVKQLRFKHILLLRDPRDIAVSHAFYIMQDTLHPHHRYYAETLKSDEERLMASIRGFEEGVEKPLQPIGEIFGAFLPWIHDRSTLVVRFEEMIGPRGGGSAKKQLDEIERIAGFVERPLDREGAHLIARNMYGKGSVTFRKGKLGDWQNHFTEAHKHAFKEVAGDLLIRLGYEEDASW
jgi:sulfotransferase 6B1